MKLSFILRAARIIRRERIDIVHAHHGRDYWRTVLAAHLSGARPKVVLHRHLAKSFGTWVSQNFLLNRVDAFIAVSGCVAEIMKRGIFEPESSEPERWARVPVRGDHSRIRVVHGAVDTDRFKPGVASSLRQEWKIDPESVIFAVVAGCPKPRGKGQREFLAAAAQIRRTHPNARFLMIGGGDLEETLRDDIQRLGLSNCAALIPWCKDMPAVMNAIDCLVHPQIGTDAFPTVIMEAMGCAKPVLATRIDGAVEQVIHGETGLIVAPDAIAELAEGMSVMLRGGNELRSRFGAAGRERVCSEFRLELLAERVLQLYRELCHLPSACVRSPLGKGLNAAIRAPFPRAESAPCYQPTTLG